VPGIGQERLHCRDGIDLAVVWGEQATEGGGQCWVERVQFWALKQAQGQPLPLALLYQPLL
jgi:hypothetical protein